MGMLDVIESVRRIVYKWVKTFTPITQNITAGDNIIHVQYTNRFEVGDTVMIRNTEVFEADLSIDFIDRKNNQIRLTSSVSNDWDVSGGDVVLIKVVHNNIIRGIHLGAPDVIPAFPAITVNGIDRSSEWLTLQSTKERYELEIGVFVKASTHEDGYKFLLETTDLIVKGLKRNLMPLVGSFEVTDLKENYQEGDINLRVGATSTLDSYRRVVIENQYFSQENWVDAIYDKDGDEYQIKLHTPLLADIDLATTSIIIPKRHVFNSWPSSVNYGNIHKGELLKASTIKWFAEEEEMQLLRKGELKLK